ncbi:MAG: TIGR02206 family membrane protein, partial [Myxococcales bacterium]|nr:TIGR02206 family membrane protein [Myxococcales bacterium]
MAAPPLPLFGPAHLVGIVGPVLVGAALALLLRRGHGPRVELAVRVGLAVFLIAMTALHVHWLIEYRNTAVWHFIPLHLCDLAIFVSLFGLASKRRILAEVLYFWTCSGTFLAMVLPNTDAGFPELRYFIYFGLHGGVVATAIVLVYGLRLYPDRRSPLRVFAVTLGYTACIAVVDFVWNQNYLFLDHKPTQKTLLNYMGPWPL